MSNETSNTATTVTEGTPLRVIKGVPFVVTELKRAGDDLRGATYPAIPKDFIKDQFKKLAELAANNPEITIFNVLPAASIAGWTFSKEKQIYQGGWENTQEDENDWNSGDIEAFFKAVEEGKTTVSGQTMDELDKELRATIDEAFKFNCSAECLNMSEADRNAKLAEFSKAMIEINSAMAAKSRPRTKKENNKPVAAQPVGA